MSDDLNLALDRLEDGDWDGAHAIVQDMPSEEAARVHALLHRIEGDRFNAEFWYRRAGRRRFEGSEAEEIALLRSELTH